LGVAIGRKDTRGLPRGIVPAILAWEDPRRKTGGYTVPEVTMMNNILGKL